MNLYADYEFYVTNFSGSIILDYDAFSNACIHAGNYIRYITFGRVSDSFEVDYPEYAENIKLAVCAMAEVFYQENRRTAKHQGREIVSENNDGYSVTYADVSAERGTSLAEKQAGHMAAMYLSHTGLLYMGV